MKNRLLMTLFTILSFYSAYGSFVIKQNEPAAKVKSIIIEKQNENVVQSNTEHGFAFRKKTFIYRIREIRNYFRYPIMYDKSKRSAGGWPGIVSFVSGLAMVASFFIASLLGPALFSSIFFSAILMAIIFGIIGLSRKYTNHGFAIAGIVLGGLGLVVIGLLIALISTLSG